MSSVPQGRTMAPLTVMDGGDLRRWAFRAEVALKDCRRQIDALNVFPVPDGDTGTNMYLTFHTALEGLVGDYLTAVPSGVVEATQALTRHMLLAARGNSGVILSQLFRGIAESVASESPGGDPLVIDAAVMARMMLGAAVAARRAVSEPKEGTILTVADAAAAAADDAAACGATLPEVTAAALAAADEALERTPEQLPVLAQAGVVDAGGAGLVVLLESLHDVVRGASPEEYGGCSCRWTDEGAGPVFVAEHVGDTGLYEVMYLLQDCPDTEAERLKAGLKNLGDSVMVVGERGLRTVHAHVEDPGAAVELGIGLGRMSAIRISWLGGPPCGVPEGPVYQDVPHRAGLLPQAALTATALTPLTPTSGSGAGSALSGDGSGSRESVEGATLGAVACAQGPGLASVFAQAGAQVVDSRPGRRATPAQLVDAICDVGCPVVVVLPNDKDTVLAARAAAHLAGRLAEPIDVHVIPTTSPIEGMAALAVLDPAQAVAENLTGMAEAAATVRCARIGVATREAVTEAGTCRPGDVLGFVDDAVISIGDDPVAVAVSLLEHHEVGSAELVTLVSGAEDPGLAERVAAEIARRWPAVETTTLVGGQRVDRLVLGVE